MFGDASHPQIHSGCWEIWFDFAFQIEVLFGAIGTNVHVEASTVGRLG